MKKYIRAVNRRLNMPKNLRKRVLNDLESSVNSRLEAGQTLDEILLEFGSPKEAAAELRDVDYPGEIQMTLMAVL